MARLGRYAIVAAASASAGVYVGTEKDQIKAAYAPCHHAGRIWPKAFGSQRCFEEPAFVSSCGSTRLART